MLEQLLTLWTAVPPSAQTSSQRPPAPQSWWGSVPAAAIAQSPSEPSRSQVTHWPSHAVLQQTPSTQKPLAHWRPTSHGWPLTAEA